MSGFMLQTQDGVLHTFYGGLEEYFDVDAMLGIVRKHGGYCTQVARDDEEEQL
ncbi:hypothetical protein Tsubulata_007197 [Turnera subulata]|uniref:Uncharacterized protein n=1 Tax=Turnera subulata TaxID=218843 RepID=A0A9Q0F6T6_9ROSI|nr:hypothetical protein Tsubulata_007197 [Turnera subulata]